MTAKVLQKMRTSKFGRKKVNPAHTICEPLYEVSIANGRLLINDKRLQDACLDSFFVANQFFKDEKQEAIKESVPVVLWGKPYKLPQEIILRNDIFSRMCEVMNPKPDNNIDEISISATHGAYTIDIYCNPSISIENFVNESYFENSRGEIVPILFNKFQAKKLIKLLEQAYLFEKKKDLDKQRKEQREEKEYMLVKQANTKTYNSLYKDFL